MPKCPCGYEFEKGTNWEKEDRPYEVLVGDEEFIEINGNFTVEEGNYHSHLTKVNLYACPKCKNVVMD